MISAQEAKKLTKENQENQIEIFLRSISTKVDHAVARGEYSISLSQQEFKTCAAALRALGYTVESFSDQRDYFAGTTYTLSWK